jgi:diguanylate cyclase (GGDEF)-like protein/PAS domain S-box-containing protein
MQVVEIDVSNYSNNKVEDGYFLLESDLISAVNASPSGLILTYGSAEAQPIVFANDAFMRLTGYSFDEVVGRNCRFLQGPLTDLDVVAEIADAVRARTAISRDILNYRKNGDRFWNRVSIQPRWSESGALIGFVGTQVDVTDAHEAEDAKSEAEARMANIAANLPGYIFQRVQNPDGSFRFSYFSESYWRLLGFEYPGEPTNADIMRHIDPRDLPRVQREVARSLASVSAATIEFRVITASGEERWLRTQSAPRESAGGAMVWDGVGIDVTVEKASKASLAYLAYYDPLTGLSNRLLFMRSLAAAVETLDVGSGPVVVFTVDIDGFQEVNDALGASIGDAVLCCVADRLAEFAMASGVAGRLGGDEFGVLRSDIPTTMDVGGYAAALAAALKAPIHVEGHEINLDACVGVTRYLAEAGARHFASNLAAELVKQANLALAEAKRAGRGEYRAFVTALHNREHSRMILRQSLQRALAAEQFIVHYHPFVDLTAGRIIGAEALVRWRHPDLGMQRPDVFIPMAEASGLIVPLGQWVFETALRASRQWQVGQGDRRTVSVNVSAVQLTHPGFIGMVEATLEATGIDPRNVELELTESVLIDSSTPLLEILNRLKQIGFGLSLDDFGTGYSSFQYLRNFPIDTVKIDQSFVRHMVIDSGDASIIRAIMTIAKSLDLKVIAEGVETQAQLDFLRAEGCLVGQGHLFSLPIAADELSALLQSGVKLPAAA